MRSRQAQAVTPAVTQHEFVRLDSAVLHGSLMHCAAHSEWTSELHKAW
jgi:hypothetical protein